MKPGEQTLLAVEGNGICSVEGGRDARPASMVIVADPHLEVRLNGIRVLGKQSVSAMDKLEVVTHQVQPVRRAKVQIAADGLTATLSIELVEGVTRSLRTQEPSAQVTVAVQSQTVKPVPFEYPEIRAMLREHGVTYNVNEPAILQLLMSQASGECICASGLAPDLGEPERYEICVTETDDAKMVGIIPIQPVKSVREGTLVAVHKPSKKGSAGFSVRGEPIVPPAIKSVLPVLGKGVVEDATGHVHAARRGRIVALPHFLDVAETLVMERGLRAADGYIEFDGDVIVRGDIEDGAEVVAGGCVYVSGMVSHAKISADGDIVISGGAFATTLRAGMRQISLARLHSLLEQMTKDIQSLMSSADQVNAALTSRGVPPVPAGRLLTKLVEDKYPAFAAWPERIETFIHTENAALSRQWESVLKQIMQQISLPKLILLTETSPLLGVLVLLEDKIKDLPALKDSEASIQVRNGQNCDIAATGRVISVEQGFYQCRIYAGQSVEAQGVPGVILGSKVQAFKVTAREVGSQAGAHTEVDLLDKEGSLEAGILHAGTSLSIGTWHHKVEKDMKQVTWP